MFFALRSAIELIKLSMMMMMMMMMIDEDDVTFVAILNFDMGTTKVWCHSSML